MAPTIGRIVHYTLTETDAALIQQHRGAFGITANMTGVGQTFPAIIVRTWGDAVNLQVFLDGPDSYWATSRNEGDGPGTWSWPPRL